MKYSTIPTHSVKQLVTEVLSRTVNSLTRHVSRRDEALEQALSRASNHHASKVELSHINWSVNPFEMDNDWSIDAVMLMFESSGVTDAFEIDRVSVNRTEQAMAKRAKVGGNLPPS